jgi:membrane protein required for colicin V production
MVWVDGVIVLVIVMTVLGGLREGFFRAAFSLLGLLMGLMLASWNYGRIAQPILMEVHSEPLANAIAFMAIALFVMGVAAVIGKLTSKTVHKMGLGCLDRIAGALFGAFQGALLVTVVILAAVAFFPQAHWLTRAKLPRMFFGICNLSTHLTPQDLGARIQLELKELKQDAPEWMHSKSGGV